MMNATMNNVKVGGYVQSQETTGSTSVIYSKPKYL